MTEQVLAIRPPSYDDGGHALFAWLRQMRDTKPIIYEERSRAWNVFRYEDALRVLSEPATFSSDFGRMIPNQRFAKGNLAATDPPQHRQLRRLVSQAFTPRTVAQLAPRITAVTHELLDAVADAGEMDLVGDLAYPLPVIVIAELLGVPIEDRDRFKQWADGLLSLEFEDAFDEEFIRSVEAARQEMDAYLLGHARERRVHPGEDLISRLVTAEVDGQRLDDEEVTNFAAVLLIAGHITTTLLLGNAVLCLDEHPDAAAALRADPSVLPSAVEEVLRYRTPFTQMMRLTNHEISLCGETIAEQQLILLWPISANHDECQFPEPDRFDIHREPNQHLGFGHGIHFCLGAPLARLEANIALGILLERFSELALIPGADPVFYESPRIFGAKRLPVAFRRA